MADELEPVGRDMTPAEREDLKTLNLARRAVSSGWPVPNKLKHKIMCDVEAKIDSEDIIHPSLIVAAWKFVLAADKHNLRIQMAERFTSELAQSGVVIELPANGR